MILALAGQFKQLSDEPENFRWLNGIRAHDLCDAGAVLQPTELRSYTEESRSICWAHVFPWKECRMKEMLYEVRCFEIKWRYDPRTCWTIYAIVSWTWKIQVSQRDSNPWPLRCRHRRGHGFCINCPASARIISSFDFMAILVEQNE